VNAVPDPDHSLTYGDEVSNGELYFHSDVRLQDIVLKNKGNFTLNIE
jgi:hypothetical protein